MTVRIHTESSEEARSRCGGGAKKKKVQHSNNKMEGPSCVINHGSKQRGVHDASDSNHHRRKQLQVETERSASDAESPPHPELLGAVKRGAHLLRLKTREGAFLLTGTRPVYGPGGGTPNLLTVKWQVIGFMLLSLWRREISPRMPSHAHTSYPSLPTW